MSDRSRVTSDGHADCFTFESLEVRNLFSFGAIPQLIRQDVAKQLYPNITGQGEVVVNIDSGVDFAHPSLAGQFFTNPGEIAGNGIDDDHNGFVDDVRGWDFYRNTDDPMDEVGHGTQTGGIISALPFTYSGDGQAYQGIAPGAKILSLKVSVPINASVQFDQHVGEALDYTLFLVQHHPEYHIVAVNLSVGALSQATFDQYEKRQVEALHDLGVFVAAAAGNTSADTVIYPAADPKVYAIGGVNPDGALTAFTNRGPKIALLAPGNVVPVLNIGESYALSGDGTSYAAPYVTGAAALLKQVDPTLSPDAIISILERSGVNTFDASSNRTYKRLDLAGAIGLAIAQVNTPKPFATNPPTIPGRFEAENFDVGNEGYAYHDSEPTNLGGQYRNTGVDIEKSSEHGYDVTQTKVGEWLDYTINVQKTGIYDFSARVASKYAGGVFHVEADGGDVTGPMFVPRTGSQQRYKTIIRRGIALGAGHHVLRLQMDVNGGSGFVGNFNWLSFSRSKLRKAIPAPVTQVLGAQTLVALRGVSVRDWLKSAAQ
jgi:subtilisin family serine protease